MKRAWRIFTAVVLLFLYIPMIVLIVGSFNTGTDLATFEGFTLRQYAELFRDGSMLRLLRNSLIIAVLSSLIATVLGTMAALGIHAMRGRMRSLVMTVTNIPMTNPDIVTGVSLALLFAFVGRMLNNNNIMGFFTLLIAHVTFNLPYVILSVMPKLRQMDGDLREAALDLGATPGYALWHVLIPECKQGIVTGALLAFTLSLDDFTISYFTTSPLVQNLSTLIYSATKLGISPVYYALSSLMFVVLLVLLMIVNRRTADNN